MKAIDKYKPLVERLRELKVKDETILALLCELVIDDIETAKESNL